MTLYQNSRSKGTPEHTTILGVHKKKKSRLEHGFSLPQSAITFFNEVVA
jgi:hypothetical protein